MTNQLFYCFCCCLKKKKLTAVGNQVFKFEGFMTVVFRFRCQHLELKFEWKYHYVFSLSPFCCLLVVEKSSMLRYVFSFTNYKQIPHQGSHLLTQIWYVDVECRPNFKSTIIFIFGLILWFLWCLSSAVAVVKMLFFSSIKLSIYIFHIFHVCYHLSKKKNAERGKVKRRQNKKAKLSFSSQIISLLSSSTKNRQSSTRHFCFGISENWWRWEMKFSQKIVFFFCFFYLLENICQACDVILSASTPWRFFLIFSIVFRLLFLYDWRWKSIWSRNRNRRQNFNISFFRLCCLSLWEFFSWNNKSSVRIDRKCDDR